jgi:ubiquinone/menaquinone biosynthesis C-methylase UbiE
MNIQVDARTYNDISYNEKGRFNSYWHQIDEITRINAQNVLEIGTGNGFVNFILEKHGVKVTTIDIDAELKPDVVGSVLSMPIDNDSFDAVLCCQVLEHLPYENFISALKEIYRVTRKNVVLSLPDLQRTYRFNIQLPVFGEVKFLYRLPRLKPLEWKFNGEHYWNISCKDHSLDRIKHDIVSAGFKIEKTFCVFEMSWHRFFILKKQ